MPTSHTDPHPPALASIAPEHTATSAPKRDGWMSLACLLVMVSLLWGICFVMETARQRVRVYEQSPDAPPPSLLPWQ